MMAQDDGYAAERAFWVPPWLRIILTLVALSELVGGLAALPVLYDRITGGVRAPDSELVIISSIVFRPLLALAALVLLRRKTMQPALLCLVAIMALEWASIMPSVRMHSLQLQEGGPFWQVALLFELILKPVIAAAVALLVALRSKPVLAGVLAAIPTAFGWLGLGAFAISVAVHGF